MKRSTLILFCSLIVWSAVAQHSGFLDRLSDYIENTFVFQQGQEEARAFYLPPGRHQSLNGDWKFYYHERPEGIPADFYTPDFDDGDWDDISVPSNWEMQGFGDKLFRNISTTYTLGRPENAPPGRRSVSDDSESSTFTVTPPEVPDEYNPTGAYRTSFTLPPEWSGQQVFLRFEKVASASFIWVNGREVGYNEGAHEPAEYNITSYLHEGENTIAVFVVKFSDGYYLEGQDYWRLAGIFGDVWLYAAPPVRLFDWQVITDLDDTFTDAELSLRVDVKSYDDDDDDAGDLRVRAKLRREGTTIATMQTETFAIGRATTTTISLNQFVADPDKWTAATPELYDLSLELLAADDRVLDRIDTRMGFKETGIGGNVFYLNGVPVKLHAINSHMQHPEGGHYVDEVTIRKDFELLKRFNFNAVRTSHYPPTNKYLELADEYGLYIIDEAGTEAHATEYLSEMPEYRPMYLDRVRKMVLRDRNHPSVLFWSAGNESGEGENITSVIREGKRLDPTRYWMYGGNADRHPGEEIIGPRYPTPIELERNIGLDTAGRRPSFMDEYLAITGNGGGGLDEYWRVIYDHPRLLGGAIWDFVSPGLTEPVRRLEDSAPHGIPAHLMGEATLVAARDGRALDLNGHDQWVEVYRADPVEISGDQLTITLEVFPRELNSSSGAFLTKGSNQFGLVQQGKRELEFYLFNGERQSLRAPLPENWNNHWHQLTAVYDGQEMKLWIDGTEAAAKVVSGAIHNLPFPINIGRDAEAHGQDTDVYLCDALIDRVGLFAGALDPTAPLRPEEAALWLDFEEETVEGTFFSYGIGARTYGAIWPDRRPQPEMWQMKKSAQPLAFSLIDPERGLVEVWNRSNFTDAAFWETTWKLMEDDRIIQSGILDLSAPPQSRALVTVPYTRPEIVPGKAYRLDISSRLKSDERWAPKGFEVSWEQLELPDWQRPEDPAVAVAAPATLKRDTDALIISGAGFIYRFDRRSGALRSMLIDGRERLKAPLQLNAWRAPLANEMDQWNGGTIRTNRWKAGFGSTISTDYYSLGIHQLKHQPIDVRAREAEGKVHIYVRELALLNDGATHFTVGDRYSTGLTLSGFESIYEYTISGDGAIRIRHQMHPQGTMPQMLPRIGLSLMVDPQLDQVSWYGRGPQENYPDRKSGYRLGIYQASLEDLYEPYLIPQDHGLRTDNRWLRLTDAAGRGLEFSMDEHFNFNAYPFTTENLTRALYPYQLQRAGGITLNLDYQTTGVGGTARPVFEAYRVYPRSMAREIVIRPLR